MKALFIPAIRLMNQIRYPGKFFLLGSAVSLVILILLFSVFKSLSRDIDVASQQLQGLQMIKPINRSAQYLQQHRGLSAGLLGGNEAMRDKRAGKEKETGDAIQATEAGLAPGLRDSPSWKKIRADWETLRSHGLSWTAPENIKAHTTLIDQLLQFMVETADATEMTLDPSMDTYYMMDTVVVKMPAMMERLGQTRARGTGVLAKKEISPQMKIDIASTLAEMANNLRAQNINLEKVIRFAPSVSAALSGPGKEFSDNVGKVFGLVREDILAERFSTAPQDYFNQTTSIIDAGYKTIFDVLIPEYERQINVRKTAAEKTLMLTMVLSLGVLVLVTYLGAGMYFSVIASVGTFSQGAKRLAEGDLTVQFDTAGRDELHGAGGDFNAMAQAFRNLLGNIQQEARELKHASEELALSSQQISSSASAQSDSASSMAASVEEMTVGVDHIASNAQNAQNYSRESDDVAAQGGSIVKGVVERSRYAEKPPGGWC